MPNKTIFLYLLLKKTIMSKKHLNLVILLLLTTILVSGCGKKPNIQPVAVNNAINNQNQNGSQSNETVNPSGSYSINELFTMNRPLKCAWKENATGDNDVTNIMYLNGKKFYQDITMGDIGHSYTIYDGEYLYIWNSFNDMASKMKNTGTKTGLEQNQDKAKDSVGLEQKKDFVCENWSADNSLFIPPQNKNFKDVTTEMNQAVQEMGNGGLEKAKQQMCDLCQGAPTQEIKDKCLLDAQCGQ
jgi:hypothetical protein